MVKPTLRLFKSTAQQFSVIRPADQSTRSMKTIMRETLNKNGIRQTQLPPVSLNPRNQGSCGFSFGIFRVIGHGVFHW